MALNPKEIILGLLVVASGIGGFWFWSEAIPLIATGEFGNYQIYIWAAAGLILSASLFCIAAIFVKEKRVIYPAAIIAIGGPFLFVTATNEAFVALVTVLLLIIYAVYRIQKEFSLSFGFSLSKFTRSGLPVYLTAASVVVSVFYLNSLDREEIVPSIFPRRVFQITTDVALDPLRFYIGLPRLKDEETIDDLFTELLREKLGSEGIDISELPPQELEKLIARQREEISSNFGIVIRGDEKPSDVFYGAVISYAERLLAPYKRYLPYFAGIAFFLAFKAFTLPVYYLSLALSFILVKIMVLAKILKLEKVSVEVEKLTL